MGTLLPPGFDSGQWPPLKAAGDSGHGQQGQPDLDMEPRFISSGDSVAARTDEGSGSEIVPMVEDASNPSLALYKAKLMSSRSTEMGTETEGEWELENEDVSIDRSGLIPKVTFSPRTHERLVEKMNSTAIIRLMGRKIGYKSLQFQIIKLWKPVGVFNLVELGNNWFLIRFGSQEDYLKSLTQGPWMLFGLYLTVQPWTPSFHPESTTISSIVAWIRFPNLPLLYYHNGVLKSIAEGVGKVYKVDRNTSNYERGKYARFAVGIDLTKPLLPHIEIDGKEQRIEYEGLPKICFKCGTYGHIIQNCPDVHKAPMQIVNTVQQEVQNNMAGNATPPNMEGLGHRHPQKPDYGPGMIAKIGGRKPGTGIPSSNQNKFVGKKVNGSRFDILGEEDNIDVEEVKKNDSRNDGEDAQKEMNLMEVTSEGGVKVNTNKASETRNKGKTKASLTLHIPHGESSSNPPSAKEDKLNLKKSSRDPLGPTPQNKRILDPSKHSVSIILDDEIHYGMPDPIYLFPCVGNAPDKENMKRHGPNKGKSKGISLAQNMHKSLKVKKAKISSSSPHSDGVQKAILETIESGINAPMV